MRASSRLWAVALVSLALIGSACGGDDDASSDTATEDTTSTTAAEEDEEAGWSSLADFDDAPAMIAAAGTRFSQDAEPSDGGGSPYAASTYGGPRLPLAYMSDPSASTSVYLASEERNNPSHVSPDGTAIAVGVEADALESARYDIISTETGETIDAVEYGTGLVGTFLWSPDSRAVFIASQGGLTLHRIGGATFQTDEYTIQGRYAFASNETVTELVLCVNDIVRLSAGDAADSAGVTVAEEACTSLIQAEGAEGEPVAVSTLGPDVSMITAGAAPEVVYSFAAPPAGSLAVNTLTCGSGVVLRTQSSEGLPSELRYHDIESGATVLIADWAWEWCPLISPARTHAAVNTTTGAVNVIDLETGAAVEVAKAGIPVAFGASGEQLLVHGGGTFIVAADGSGGDEASVQAAPSGGNNRTFCRAGSTGVVLLLAEDGVQIFDIDEDQATPTEGLSLPEGCTMTPDEKWIVAGTLLANLDTGESVVLPGIEMPTGDRVPEDSLAPGQSGVYSWHGPQVLVAGRAVRE